MKKEFINTTYQCLRLMFAHCLPPSDAEFSFEEKMRFEYLHRHWGKDWQKIASGLGTKTTLDVKQYWLKKSAREKEARDVFSRISLTPTITYAKNEGTKITISPSVSPFLWELTPVVGQTKNFETLVPKARKDFETLVPEAQGDFENLEILAHAAAMVSNK